MDYFSNPFFNAFVLILAICLSCLYLSSTVAHEKGHNEGHWALVGLIFGPLGVIAAAGLPDLRTRRLLKELTEKTN